MFGFFESNDKCRESGNAMFFLEPFAVSLLKSTELCVKRCPEFPKKV